VYVDETGNPIYYIDADGEIIYYSDDEEEEDDDEMPAEEREAGYTTHPYRADMDLDGDVEGTMPQESLPRVGDKDGPELS
jgi:hypothetical protein